MSAATSRNGCQAKALSIKELETILEKKVFLELFVKVQKNWLKDKNAIRQFGFE